MSSSAPPAPGDRARQHSHTSDPLLVQSLGTWRQPAIVAIKAAHSAIFLVNATAVLHVFCVGLTGRRSRWPTPALIAALTESAVFVANRGECPLTDLVESLGARSGRVSDIFLPRWCANRIPQIFGPLLIVGVLGMTARALSHGVRTGNWIGTWSGGAPTHWTGSTT
jgi:hypothetical protein